MNEKAKRMWKMAGIILLGTATLYACGMATGYLLGFDAGFNKGLFEGADEVIDMLREAVPSVVKN